jgi:hypothetical protein
VHIEIACVESVIANEIAQGLTQRDVAQTYALGLRSSSPTDWGVVNAAILERWSPSGLGRIKEAAWTGRWRGGPLFESDGPAEVGDE